MRIVELILDEQQMASGIDAISVVEAPAIESNFVALKYHEVKFAKVDAEKRILMGPILIPDKPIYRKQIVDGELDEFYIYFSKQTVAKASQMYLMNSKQSNTTLEHGMELNGLCLVETWLKEDMEKDKSAIYGMTDPIGTWMGSLKGDAERVSHGEDAFDPGGYFIVNGTERVLMTLEDLASNKIMTEFTERYNERIYVAKVFSQFRGYRALVVVERNRKNLLEVSFPSVAGHLRFVDLMRSLGLVSDHEIVNAVSTDEDILTFMMQNLEESECDNLEGGIMYVGKKLAPNQTRDYQRKRAEFVLDNYLLPHLNYLMPATLKEGDEGYQEAVAEVRLAKAHFSWRRPSS